MESFKATIAAHERHIATLQAENERLGKLVQTIADDKFFKVNTVRSSESEDTQNSSPYSASDYNYEVEPPSLELYKAIQEEEAEEGDRNFDADLDVLQKAHDKFIQRRT